MKKMISLPFKRISAFVKAIKSIFFQRNEHSRFDSDDGLDEVLNVKSDTSLSKAKRIILTIVFFLILFSLWAYFFSIDEVSKGDGKVIPISKEQSIQSLDGGVIQKIFVREGEIVEANAPLVQLDIVRTESSVGESESKYRAYLAQLARLTAEVNDIPLTFPEELNAYPDLIKTESYLYTSRKAQYRDSIANIKKSKVLISKELNINNDLEKQGAASAVDVIRLRRQLVDLNMKENELKTSYYVKSREEITKVSAEISSLRNIIRGRNDILDKSKITSPVRGIIKDIEISTIGGVVSPNGVIMHIVPIDDTLLIEARISPKDIAFIRPDQEANVKITAYDYSIYGGLNGRVVMISPDTIKDEQKPDTFYYRVYIRTDKDHLETKSGQKMYITPGMVASVDIKTGSKTVAQYLAKPFNKINEALRER